MSQPGGNEIKSTDSRTIVIQPIAAHPMQRWGWRLLIMGLIISIILNFSFYSQYQAYFQEDQKTPERFHSGDKMAQAKIAVIKMDGTIMPPYTEQLLNQIKRAKEDEDVKGVVLTVDSPGGLVADSHQIYHSLQELGEEKPIYVAMQRMAASGGYYIAMGAGPKAKIFVEPTTWTGSIGVIIPRFDFSGLAEEWKVKSVPLKTGPFKDALNPFKEMTDAERGVWDAIMKDAFDRFIGVIVDGRENLNEEQVRALATGQVYTAQQALDNGLVDEMVFEADAIAALQTQLGLTNTRVVKYEQPKSLMDAVLSGEATAKANSHPLQSLIDASVPRAMYLCSWSPVLPR